MIYSCTFPHLKVCSAFSNQWCLLFRFDLKSFQVILKLDWLTQKQQLKEHDYYWVTFSLIIKYFGNFIIDEHVGSIH